MSDASEVLARIDRLESLDAIRQLAAKYSLALDMRNLDALVNLFPEDVRVGRDKVGSALYDDTYRKESGVCKISRTGYRCLWEEYHPRGDDIQLRLKPIC
jgi:hypothetical protein